jgi:hypothetical protein
MNRDALSLSTKRSSPCSDSNPTKLLENLTLKSYMEKMLKMPNVFSENEKMKSETLSTGSGAILLIDDEEIILNVGKDML